MGNGWLGDRGIGPIKAIGWSGFDGVLVNFVRWKSGLFRVGVGR
jgi:hypothetical protein